MSYNGQKLKFFVDDSDGCLRKNREAADRFIMAEDDGETREMWSLMDPHTHFSSFWGVVRGLPAAAALRAQENEHLRLTWTTALQPLTSRTFVRQGYVHVVHGQRIASLPLIGPWISSFFQKPIQELVVVRDGRVTFRSIGYMWDLGKY